MAGTPKSLLCKNRYLMATLTVSENININQIAEKMQSFPVFFAIQQTVKNIRACNGIQ
jgi:hypothetical protein